MYKLIVISDKKKNSLSFRLASRLFDFNSTYMQDSQTLLKFLKDESPNFAFVDLKEKSDQNDFAKVFDHINMNDRIRVTVFNLDSVKSAFLRLFPLDMIDFLLSLFLRRKAVKQ